MAVNEVGSTATGRHAVKKTPEARRDRDKDLCMTAVKNMTRNCLCIPSYTAQRLTQRRHRYCDVGKLEIRCIR